MKLHWKVLKKYQNIIKSIKQSSPESQNLIESENAMNKRSPEQIMTSRQKQVRRLNKHIDIITSWILYSQLTHCMF